MSRALAERFFLIALVTGGIALMLPLRNRPSPEAHSNQALSPSSDLKSPTSTSTYLTATSTTSAKQPSLQSSAASASPMKKDKYLTLGKLRFQEKNLEYPRSPDSLQNDSLPPENAQLPSGTKINYTFDPACARSRHDLLDRKTLTRHESKALERGAPVILTATLTETIDARLLSAQLDNDPCIREAVPQELRLLLFKSKSQDQKSQNRRAMDLLVAELARAHKVPIIGVVDRALSLTREFPALAKGHPGRMNVAVYHFAEPVDGLGSSTVVWLIPYPVEQIDLTVPDGAVTNAVLAALSRGVLAVIVRLDDYNFNDFPTATAYAQERRTPVFSDIGPL